MPSELLEAQQQQTAELLEKVAEMVMSTDASNPGHALRLDRLERQIAAGVRVLKWVGSGGLLGFAGTILLLRQLLHAMEQVGGQ